MRVAASSKNPIRRKRKKIARPRNPLGEPNVQKRAANVKVGRLLGAAAHHGRDTDVERASR
jgi:hypothetical protein